MTELTISRLDALDHDLREALRHLSMDACRDAMQRCRDGLRDMLILRSRPTPVTGATAMEWRLARERAEEADKTLRGVDMCLADINQGPEYIQYRIYAHCAAEMLILIRAEKMKRKHLRRAG